MPTLYDQIPVVLDWFDFERVHKVMTALDWRWATTKPLAMSVPTIEEIRATAFDILHRTVADFTARGRPLTGAVVSTGGLEARINVFNASEAPRHAPVNLQLLFYVDCVHVPEEQPLLPRS